MPTIVDMGAAIARIESLEPEDAKRRLKELRNLTQRLPFIPVGRDWQSDVYDFPSIAALRLVQVAAGLGVTRPVLAKMVAALHETDRSEPFKAGMRGRVMDQMVARVKAGESFKVSIKLFPGGEIVVRAGGEPTAETDAVFASAGYPEPIASVEIHADRLIRELLAELGDA